MRLNLLLFLPLVFAKISFGQLTASDEQFIDSLMHKYDIPGMSIAIVQDYELAYVKAFGVKSSDTQEKLTTETLLQAASISKSITASLVMRMAEQDLLNLDQSVNSYLEDWKLQGYKKDEALVPTVRQLLSHTGGTNMSGYAGYYSFDRKIPDLTMILNNRKYAHFWESRVFTKYQPNTGFNYSGGGYCVVQKAIEDISARSFPELVKDEILDPCGMTSSFINTYPDEARKKVLSSGHNKKGNVIKGGYHIHPQLAAAGLWTTPRDLAFFLIKIMRSANPDQFPDAEFLSVESIEEMIKKPILNNGSTSGYGLGFGLSTSESGEVSKISHSGSQWGFGSRMYADLTTGKAVVVMMNRHKMAFWPFTDLIMNRIDYEL